jgi:hypothetical protein
MAVPSSGPIGISDFVSALGVTSGGPYSYMGNGNPATAGSLVNMGGIYGQLNQGAFFNTWWAGSFITQNSLRFFISGRVPTSYPGTGTSVTDIQTGNVGTKGSTCPFNASYCGYFGIQANSQGFITFPHNNNYNCNGQFSIIAWVQPQASNYLMIAVKGPSGTATSNYPGNFELRTTPNGAVETLFQTSPGLNFRYYYTANNVVPAGPLSWYHIAAVTGGDYNGGTTIYVNGVSKAYTTYGTPGTPNQTNTQPVYVGFRGDGVYCAGGVAMVGIYNRLLSATEVTDSYNAIKNCFI